MTCSAEVTLALTVDGRFGKAPIGPFFVEYKLSGQTGGLGPQQVCVAAAAGPSSVSASLAGLSQQSLLLICTDNEVFYELNNDGVQRSIKATGFVILPGQPVVQTLEFGGNGSTDADVTILQLGTQGAPITGVGGSLIVEPEQIAGASQTAFTLVQTPAVPSKVLMFIDGTMTSTGNIVVVDNALTYSGPALSGGELIQFVF